LREEEAGASAGGATSVRMVSGAARLGSFMRGPGLLFIGFHFSAKGMVKKARIGLEIILP
jgi:hypothetical protein